MTEIGWGCVGVGGGVGGGVAAVKSLKYLLLNCQIQNRLKLIAINRNI